MGIVSGIRDGQTYLICGTVALVILLIDINIPLGVASGVPYIVVILLSLRVKQRSTTFILASICSLFVIIGFFASPGGGILWQVLTNRLLAIFAVWVTALLAVKQLDKERLLNDETLKAIQVQQSINLQEEKIRILKVTMRTVLDIVGNFLNNLQIIRYQIEKNKTLTESEITQLDDQIHQTAVKLKQIADIEIIQEKEMAGGMPGLDYEQQGYRTVEVKAESGSFDVNAK